MVRASRLNADRPACQDEACAIQTCLSRTSYNEQKCSAYVDALYQCCDAFYKEMEVSGTASGGASSTACPMKSVVERRFRASKASKAQADQ